MRGLQSIARAGKNVLIRRQPKKKKISDVNNRVSYTKRYACKRKRQQVSYEHGINRERNLLANPDGNVILRRTYI